MAHDPNTASKLTKDFLALAEVKRLELSQRWTLTFNGAAHGHITTEKCAIRCDVMLGMLSDALQAERIEPYQATLMLVANAKLPFKLRRNTYTSWASFLPVLIGLHNNDAESFVKKKRFMLNNLMYGGIATYGRLRNAGLNRNHDVPGDPDHVDTEREIIFDNDDGIVHDRRPKLGKKENIEAAIPKKVLLPWLKEAIAQGHMEIEQACLILAINVHAMDRRWSGERYLDHVMAVAADPALTHQQRLVAVMHDVLENSDWTADDLRDIGLGIGLTSAITYITKRPDETVYLHFIERVACHSDALAVKMADIRHNMADAKPDKKAKYELALKYLEAIQDRRIRPGASIETFARRHDMYKEELFRPEVKKDKAATHSGDGLTTSPQASAPPPPA